jgi:tetratricopeptide (TPR) repeat protein
MWSRWVRLGIATIAVPLAWASWRAIDNLRFRGEMILARKELAQGRREQARARLAALASARPGALGGEVDCLLGVCESALGRIDAALDAFGRVPSTYVFDAQAARFEAEANLQRGRLRAAETRLEEALSRGGPGLNEIRRLLSRVYEIQLRVDDSLTLYRSSLPESSEPFLLLQRISSLEGGTLPLESLKDTLDEAASMAPADDRVWLGQARLAMQMGQWDQALSLLRHCQEKKADAPVWRSLLEWSQGAGKPAEALIALQGLGIENLTALDSRRIHAWTCLQAGDVPGQRAALKAWLDLEPRAIPALERMAALAEQPAEAVDYRRRKAAADRALDRYRARVRMGSARDFQTVEEKIDIARLAEQAGLVRDAADWFRLVQSQRPGDSVARDALPRLEEELARRDEKSEPDSSGERLLARLADLADRNRQPGEVQLARTPISFVDDADSVGLRFVYENGESKIHQIPETTGGGVGLLDFDGDGWIDVYVVQGGTFPTAKDRPSSGDRLFRNRGNGTFEDATRRAGLEPLCQSYGHGVTVGDYDNDGRPDLFLTRWRSYVLLRNRGDGTFEDVTARAGLSGDRDWPTSAALADLDGDGDLDLYVCHYGVWDSENPKLCRNETTGAYISCNPLELPARPDHLFRNDGGKFVDVSEQAGIVDANGRGLGVAAADFDGDGRIDLYVANDLTANYLWRNLGNWKFEEVGQSSGVAGNATGGFQASMGVAAGDLDGDGRIDLAVTNFYGESTTFYRNLGDGAFTDCTAAVGMDVATRRLLGFGVAFLDVDNDGRLDLASANGHVNDLRPHFPYLMPAQLLVGDARGTMLDVSSRAGEVWTKPRMGRGLAAGDLDNDGRVDLVLLGHNEPLAYFHNRSGGGHFVTIQLQGKPPGTSRDAIGTRLTVLAGGQKLVSWRVGGCSYQSANDPRLHFGLGPAVRIDALEVAWPSGRVDRHRDLPADAGYLLKEGAERPERLHGFAPAPRH